MPIYEYKCAECGKHIEKMQKVSDAPLTVCEACGGKLEKQWSLSGFQLKGEGWYVTDYSNKLKATGADKSDKPEKTEKIEKTEKVEKDGKAEKSSAAESTAVTESASNKSNDTVSSSTKDAAAKKD
ncbi:MAG: zinc ribbon domain-containing protein [Pyrinomonadaceae bacterium]|nr:zinc ribbon domain-containing protein [Pyrinomonadaceae bacterium]